MASDATLAGLATSSADRAGAQAPAAGEHHRSSGAPIERPAKRLLVVERGGTAAAAIDGLVGRDKGVNMTVASSEEATIQALTAAGFDCVVLGPGLPKRFALRLLERMAADRRLHGASVLLCPDRPFTEREQARLRQHGPRLAIKVLSSPDQLTAETAVALHRTPARPFDDRGLGHRESDGALAGRKVLLVDDDVRNLFALASLLEERGMTVVFGETGTEALAALGRHRDIDIVLMDIMMPDMDGHQTIAAIRKMPHLADLPVIAVTAKAMQGDREESLRAGASDYITKPVEPEKLTALIGQWLSR
jgi:CheY-like chemotaxis protein